MATQFKGFDISHYNNANGAIDFKKAKDGGYTFVIIKATEGSEAGTKYLDPYFIQNVNDAFAAGLQVWAYHFFLGVSIQDAKDEADWFIKNAAPVKDKIAGMFVDVESNSLNPSPGILTTFVNAFVDEVKAANYAEVGLYTGLYYLTSRLIEANLRVDLKWYAAYNNVGLGHPADAWQNTDKATVPGVPNTVDGDISYNPIIGNIVPISAPAPVQTPAVAPAEPVKVAPAQPAPTPAPVKAAPVANVPTYYTIVNGDTLSGIAIKFGIDQATIQKLNGITNPNLIRLGQVLQLKSTAKPAPVYKTYRVVSGDNLSTLAVKWGTTVADIKALNGLKSDTIVIGQVLKIPNGAKQTVSIYHAVVSGDTLSELAAQYSTTVASIKTLNHLTSDTIIIGQKLRVK